MNFQYKSLLLLKLPNNCKKKSRHSGSVVQMLLHFPNKHKAWIQTPVPQKSIKKFCHFQLLNYQCVI
jgi:hypothetical protein